jgi:uncharacterized membrane protein YgdD (TMEM256/DUF423 family)
MRATATVCREWRKLYSNAKALLVCRIGVIQFMSSVARRWIAIGGALGALGVAFGAFGAHGLSDFLSARGYAGDDLSRRLDIFNTAIQYQMVHSLALVITGLALVDRPSNWWRIAGWAFLVGIILFSGLLKVLAFAGPQWKWLGAVVPIGGVSLIAAWIALAVGAFRKA